MFLLLFGFAIMWCCCSCRLQNTPWVLFVKHCFQMCVRCLNAVFKGMCVPSLPIGISTQPRFPNLEEQRFPMSSVLCNKKQNAPGATDENPRWSSTWGDESNNSLVVRMAAAAHSKTFEERLLSGWRFLPTAERT